MRRLIAALAVVMAACGDEGPAAPPEPGHIDVTVTLDEQPYAGVEVRFKVGGQRLDDKTADANGKASLAVMQLSTHTVSAYPTRDQRCPAEEVGVALGRRSSVTVACVTVRQATAADGHATERHKVAAPVFVDGQPVVTGKTQDGHGEVLSNVTLQAVLGYSVYLKRPWLVKSKRYQRLDLPDTVRARWYASRPGRDTAHIVADLHLPKLEWGDGAYVVRIDSVKPDSAVGYIGPNLYEFLPGGAWTDSLDVSARAGWKASALVPVVDTTTTEEVDTLPAASVGGLVRVDGKPWVGAPVALMTDPTNNNNADTTFTDAAGFYRFDSLPPRVLQVRLLFEDTEYADYRFYPNGGEYAFRQEGEETRRIDFDGFTGGRTSAISGRVAAEGTPLADVRVVLDGWVRPDTTRTNAYGQYAFVGLPAGEYSVSLSDFDTLAVTFDSTRQTLDLSEDESALVNFAGEWTRRAEVSGVAYLDADGDCEPDAGEGRELNVTLQGPGVGDVITMLSDEDGSFAFGSLAPGSYRLLVNPPAGTVWACATTGTGVSVDLGPAETKTVNLALKSL